MPTSQFRTQIVGILNITRDSFSDGGKFLEADAAIEHARRMAAQGADIIDVGAESTHPDAQSVPPAEEIARLTPVITRLKQDGLRVSVDTHKPQVMRYVLSLGVDFINDVTALRLPEAVAAVRDSAVRLILMHSRAAGARAERTDVDPAGVVDDILAFFERRLSDLERTGIVRERVIIDPGMGFFLGSNPEASLAVLRELPRLNSLGLPVMVSTSRKSFIGAVLGDANGPRPVTDRAAGTLATELWAVQNGAAYIRTHDPRALHDALSMWSAIQRP